MYHICPNALLVSSCSESLSAFFEISETYFLRAGYEMRVKVRNLIVTYFKFPYSKWILHLKVKIFTSNKVNAFEIKNNKEIAGQEKAEAKYQIV